MKQNLYAHGASIQGRSLHSSDAVLGISALVFYIWVKQCFISPKNFVGEKIWNCT